MYILYDLPNNEIIIIIIIIPLKISYDRATHVS